MKQLIKRLWEPKYILFFAVCYTLFISIALLSPIHNAPKIEIPFADKIVHIFINAFLFIIWSLFLGSKKTFTKFKKNSFFLFVGVLVYGILIEVVQETFVPTRSADVFDVVANICGLLLGLFVVPRFKKLIY